jgi:hypothetical protein
MGCCEDGDELLGPYKAENLSSQRLSAFQGLCRIEPGARNGGRTVSFHSFLFNGEVGASNVSVSVRVILQEQF